MLAGGQMVERLDRALDDLLALRMAAGVPPPLLPEGALDSTLLDDAEFQRARVAFEAALRAASPSGCGQPVGPLAELGSTVNTLIWHAACAGWRLGVVVGQGSRFSDPRPGVGFNRATPAG